MNEDDKDVQGEGASPEPDNATPPDTLEVIKRLHEEHDGNLNKVAQSLNESGIKSPRGREWSYQTLRSYVASRAPELLKTRGEKKDKKKPKGAPKTSKAKQTPEKKVAKTDEPAPRTPPRVPPPPPPGPDPLAAYVKLPDQRVAFKKVERTHQKGNSYRVHEDLYRLAEEKAKKDEVRTGGSMASLVEVLLWAYVGGPKDFLVPLYNEESAGTETTPDETPKKRTEGSTAKKTGKGQGGRRKKT